MLSAVSAPSATMATIHTRMRMRSRRAMERARTTVPANAVFIPSPSSPAITADTLGVPGQIVAVMPQEQLFEGWGMADEAADTKLAEPADRCIKVIGID